MKSDHLANINSSRSIISIVYLAVIGPCVFILQPGFVQGLVQYMSFTEVQAGQIASIEMFGIAATTVLLSFIASKVDWQKFLTGCLVLCVAGNFLSVGQTEFVPLALIRFLTGLGSGGIVSLTFTMMGLTGRADRNFGYIIVWVLTYGAFGLLAMPSAFALVGMNGVLVFFGLFCLSGLWFVKALPRSGPALMAEQQAAPYPSSIKVTSISGILIYNIAIGIVWAYLFLVGIEAGMSEQAVANALTVSQFLGITGAFLAVLLEVRLGRLVPLAFGVVGGAASIYLLLGDIGSSSYWLAACAFNFLWNLSMPYLLATLADFDRSGQVVVHGVSMQFVGLALGPFVAAALLSTGGYDTVNGVASLLLVVAALLLLPGVLAQRVRLMAD